MLVSWLACDLAFQDLSRKQQGLVAQQAAESAQWGNGNHRTIDVSDGIADLRVNHPGGNDELNVVAYTDQRLARTEGANDLYRATEVRMVPISHDHRRRRTSIVPMLIGKFFIPMSSTISKSGLR